MRRYVLAGAVAALTSMALTAGCDAGDPGSGPGSHPGSEESAATEAAADRLARAVEDAMSSGRYRQTVTTPALEEPYYEVTGAYDVDAGRFTADMSFWNSEAGETRSIKHTFVDAHGFQQAQGWHGSAAGCWLMFDSRSLSAARQTDLTSVEAPGAVLALRDAVGDPSAPADADVVRGTVELREALSLMLPGFIRQQGTLPDGPVDASFTLDGDRLVGWEVHGQDLVPALSRTGALDNGVVAGLGSFTLEVAYDDVGRPVTVRQPPRRLWMTPRAMDAGRGCRG